MSVIKEEYISDKITDFDLLPMSFLKMSAYTGSKRKLRYKMERSEEVLKVWTWSTPFAFDKTDSSEMQLKEFPFSKEGVEEAKNWLNEQLSLLECKA